MNKGSRMVEDKRRKNIHIVFTTIIFHETIKIKHSNTQQAKEPNFLK